MTGNASFGLLLSLLAGLSTGIGSAIAYFIRRPKPWLMALILGFSAGVMIYVSFAELLKASLEQIGLLSANIWFFVGILFIALLDVLVPHEYKQERVEDTHPGYIHHRQRRRQGQLNRMGRMGLLVALPIAAETCSSDTTTGSRSPRRAGSKTNGALSSDVQRLIHAVDFRRNDYRNDGELQPLRM